MANKLSSAELRDLIKIAKQAPGCAHLPVFGLILAPDQKGPICELCGGTDAPIVDGVHLDGWCIGGEKSSKYAKP